MMRGGPLLQGTSPLGYQQTSTPYLFTASFHSKAQGGGMATEYSTGGSVEMQGLPRCSAQHLLNPGLKKKMG